MKKTLSFHLEERGLERDLRHLIAEVANAVKCVARKCKYEFRGKAGSENVFGESQLALDVVADKIFTERMENSGLVSVIASEEKDSIHEISPDKKGKFALAFDPLDGSSLVDVNFAVGTICAIFESDTFVGQKGQDMKAALFAVYGPQTTLVVSFLGKTHEYRLNEIGEFELEYEDIKIREDAKNFAPGNLRACNENEIYKEQIISFMDEQYTLRYSGGMVPDINHILIKGQGIFSYPPCNKYPSGKLRLLFECAPLSFIISNAGGYASDGSMNILEKEIREISDRTPIFIGSRNEVRKFEN